MSRRSYLSLTCALALTALVGLPQPRESVSALLSAESAMHSSTAAHLSTATPPSTATHSSTLPTPLISSDALATALRTSARICKPGGPWGAHLEARSLGPGDVVNLDVVFLPRLPNNGLRWSLELPPGTEVRAGRSSGELSGTPGVEVREPLSVRLPPGLQAGSVRLDVTPLTDSSDSPLSSSRELDFGVAPVVGHAQLFEAETGAQSALLVLPSSTREGR